MSLCPVQPRAGDVLDCPGAWERTGPALVEDAGGEPLAVVFKAMAQSRLAMAQALNRWVASPSCAIKGENRIVELHALFDSLSFNKARMLLSYWDWASREAGPYTDSPSR